MTPVRRSNSIRCIAATAAAIIALATIDATAAELAPFEAVAAPAMADGRLLATKSARQGLWIVNNLHFNNIAYISDIQGAWLHSSGRPVAAVAFAGLNLGPPGDVAFDRAGNLWATFCWGDQTTGIVVKLTPAELRRLANRERINPKVVIHFPGTYWLACPTGLTFDQSGNLWIANTDQPFQSIVE
jgi:hypothetical protein